MNLFIILNYILCLKAISSSCSICECDHLNHWPLHILKMFSSHFSRSTSTVWGVQREGRVGSVTPCWSCARRNWASCGSWSRRESRSTSLSSPGARCPTYSCRWATWLGIITHLCMPRHGWRRRFICCCLIWCHFLLWSQ